MASTETRTGFRLPWSSDHAPESAPEPIEDEMTEAAVADPGMDPSAGPGEAEPELADVRSDATGPAQQEVAAVSTVSTQAPSRRPTKFLADLTKAMRTAAESEREEILNRFQTDAKTFVEQLHDRSAGEAVDLRKSSDQDIGEIRDWSKAEIARIREETDRRVASRREQLEQELADQAARIEHEIERVQASVGAFEATMARFFEDLLAEEDPTEFAARAANLPEPPSLEDVVDDAAYDVELERITGTTPEPVAAIEPAVTPIEPAVTPIESVATTVEAEASATPADVVPDETGPAEASVPSSGPWGDDDGLGAIEAAMTPDRETPEGTTDPWAEATWSSPEPTAAEGTPIESVAAEAVPTEALADATVAPDPRVAALGLSPDFAAAEAEAASFDPAVAGEEPAEEPAEALDDASIAARLAGLVPSGDDVSETRSTQLIVTGLVSVASIAGFKRQIAGIPDVHSVGVSSGPDGEFVFTVHHGGGVDLANAVTTMPGFAARVTSSGEGVLHVAAHDPESV